MAQAVNGQSGRDVGGTEMRPAVDGFSGASRLLCSCKVCLMWHGKLPSPTAAANGFFRLELLQKDLYTAYISTHIKTDRPSARMCS